MLNLPKFSLYRFDNNELFIGKQQVGQNGGKMCHSTEIAQKKTSRLGG
jgi:hypothetical protein